jgi:hypothetical protein
MSRLRELHERMLEALRGNLKNTDDPSESDRIRDAIKYQERTLASLGKSINEIEKGVA